MISCPKCQYVDRVLSKQPEWVFTENPNEDVIRVENHCHHCNTVFVTTHNIGEAV